MPIGQEFLIKEPKEGAEDPREWQYNKLDYIKGLVADFVTTRTDPKWHRDRIKELLPNLGKPGQKPTEDEIKGSMDVALNFTPLGITKAAKGASKIIPGSAEWKDNLAKYLEDAEYTEPMYRGGTHYGKPNTGIWQSITSRPETGAHMGNKDAAGNFSMYRTQRSQINRELGKIEGAPIKEFDLEKLTKGEYTPEDIGYINKAFDNAYKEAKTKGLERYWKDNIVEKVVTNVKKPIRLKDEGNFSVRSVIRQLMDNHERHGFNKSEVEWLKRTGDAMEKAEAMSLDIASGSAGAEAERKVSQSLINFLKIKGYDSIVYKNSVENKGTDSLIILHPETVKNVIANSGEFNPKSPNRFRSMLTIPLGGTLDVGEDEQLRDFEYLN